MTRIIDRVRCDDAPAKWEPDTMELTRIKWTEEVEVDYEVVTERLVWSGGAEREIDHVPSDSLYHSDVYYDIDGEIILECWEPPAYTQELGRETVTRTETQARYAWANTVPEWAEDTGKTKQVGELDND